MGISMGITASNVGAVLGAAGVTTATGGVAGVATADLPGGGSPATLGYETAPLSQASSPFVTHHHRPLLSALWTRALETIRGEVEDMAAQYGPMAASVLSFSNQNAATLAALAAALLVQSGVMAMATGATVPAGINPLDSSGGGLGKRDVADIAQDPHASPVDRMPAIRELGQRRDVKTLCDIIRTGHSIHYEVNVRIKMTAIDALRAMDTSQSWEALCDLQKSLFLLPQAVGDYLAVVVRSIEILKDFKDNRQSAVQIVNMMISGPHFPDISLLEAFARWNTDDALVQAIRGHALTRLAENGSPQAATALIRISEDVGLSEAQMEMIAATPQRPQTTARIPNPTTPTPRSRPPVMVVIPSFPLDAQLGPLMAAAAPVAQPKAIRWDALLDTMRHAIGMTPTRTASKLLGVNEVGLRPLLEEMGRLMGDGLKIVQRCQNDSGFKAQVTAALQSLENHEPHLQSVAKDARDRVNGHSRFKGLEID